MATIEIKESKPTAKIEAVKKGDVLEFHHNITGERGIVVAIKDSAPSGNFLAICLAIDKKNEDSPITAFEHCDLNVSQILRYFSGEIVIKQ